MNHDPLQWGRPNNETYGQYNNQIAQANVNNTDSFPKMNTQQPIITGTSVLGIKFKNGVILAADNLGSYGSLLRFNNIERLIKVGSETIVGISGDISDLQYIERVLDEIETEQNYDGDGGHSLRAPHVHAHLSLLLYHRRNKMDPLWNAVIVGGFNDDKTPFLKYVDLLGVTYQSSTIATGFGSHLAIPLLRKLIPDDKDYEKVEESEAREAIMNSLKVLYYRDARAADKYSLVTITVPQDSEAAPLERGDIKFTFEKELKVEGQSWKFAEDIRGYGSAQQ